VERAKIKRSLTRVYKWLQLDRLPPIVRRIIVATTGIVVILMGLVMVVLPGPAFIVIPLGLLILASEFAWARWIIKKGYRGYRRGVRKFWRKRTPAEQA
jgi:hypothetical protein